jgi:hypothetical protein
MLSGAASAKFPAQFDKPTLGFKAEVQEKSGLQAELF